MLSSRSEHVSPSPRSPSQAYLPDPAPLTALLWIKVSTITPWIVNPWQDRLFFRNEGAALLANRRVRKVLKRPQFQLFEELLLGLAPRFVKGTRMGFTASGKTEDAMVEGVFSFHRLDDIQESDVSRRSTQLVPASRPTDGLQKATLREGLKHFSCEGFGDAGLFADILGLKSFAAALRGGVRQGPQGVLATFGI